MSDLDSLLNEIKEESLSDETTEGSETEVGTSTATESRNYINVELLSDEAKERLISLEDKRLILSSVKGIDRLDKSTVVSSMEGMSDKSILINSAKLTNAASTSNKKILLDMLEGTEAELGETIDAYLERVHGTLGDYSDSLDNVLTTLKDYESKILPFAGNRTGKHLIMSEGNTYDLFMDPLESVWAATHDCEFTKYTNGALRSKISPVMGFYCRCDIFRASNLSEGDMNKTINDSPSLATIVSNVLRVLSNAVARISSLKESLEVLNNIDTLDEGSKYSFAMKLDEELDSHNKFTKTLVDDNSFLEHLVELLEFIV